MAIFSTCWQQKQSGALNFACLTLHSSRPGSLAVAVLYAPTAKLPGILLLHVYYLGSHKTAPAPPILGAWPLPWRQPSNTGPDHVWFHFLAYKKFLDFNRTFQDPQNIFPGLCHAMFKHTHKQPLLTLYTQSDSTIHHGTFITSCKKCSVFSQQCSRNNSYIYLHMMFYTYKACWLICIIFQDFSGGVESLQMKGFAPTPIFTADWHCC